MRHDKRPLFKHNELYPSSKYSGLFALTPVIPQILIIAIVFGLFRYFQLSDYFSQWMTYIYYGVKVIIALEIIIAGAKSLFVPILAIVLGALNLYYMQAKNLTYISMNDSRQLIIIGAIAFVITFIVRSTRKH